MTRQMQELWLFGQLKTLDQSGDLKEKIDQDAREVAEMLTQLLAAKGAIMDEDESGNAGRDTDMVMDGTTNGDEAKPEDVPSSG